MATIKETYAARHREIKTRLRKLDKALTRHSKQFKENKTNWGYVGDLGHVNEVLSELETFSKKYKPV